MKLVMLIRLLEAAYNLGHARGVGDGGPPALAALHAKQRVNQGRRADDIGHVLVSVAYVDPESQSEVR